MSLCWADRASSALLPSVVCLSVLMKHRLRGGRSPLLTLVPWKENYHLSVTYTLEFTDVQWGLLEYQNTFLTSLYSNSVHVFDNMCIYSQQMLTFRKVLTKLVEG